MVVGRMRALAPFCPLCAEREFGHRVHRDRRTASPEMTRGFANGLLDEEQDAHSKGHKPKA
jgi:hypothetical protein